MKGFCELLHRRRDVRLSEIEHNFLNKTFPVYSLESTYGQCNPNEYHSEINTFDEEGSIVINVLREYYLLDSPDFISVVDYVSEKRHLVAESCGSYKPENFGLNRFSDDSMAERWYLPTPFKSEERIKTGTEYIFSHIPQNSGNNRVRIDNQTVIVKLGNMFEILTSFPELGNVTTSLLLKLTPSGLINSFEYRDDLDVDIQTYVREYEKIFTEVIADKEKVPLLHWYLARITPILRGGGTLAEWMCIPFLDFKRWKVETWSKAAVLDINLFFEEYPSYYE